MYKVKVYVTLRERVLDPQGAAIKQSLEHLGYREVKEVRAGKFLELLVEPSGRDLDAIIQEVCGRVLANPVIEDYRYEIEECVAP
ncbi:phosphoribosylformylglycinamidine synthase subunit PurS [Weizmannia acidilactici]|jgi:phosphoribosylformylglycinamidine synthase|uniref:Phosphoribosylformylglycinamidine synthase subunit PurS n=1 Tax=Weizmannia acidilactici TaxID=2607726 RepID=A0A5J4JGA3_9BACI|nr:phosphoribosylformylglycinamidine synthase subunit PurS [Weizmannia acidilactici]GER68020.1 phosphoribosylformylglycinamidine synthase subunit PurS [Weizmannia acidilactici]GER70711.1 phosphoribosylformylglycinamidine synthase subunit PurS [Weizmannia acidilactici]GER74204.1 phosphoribosylformylglycinamidine synthase subunit PurS [Weizmannia acidilactici]